MAYDLEQQESIASMKAWFEQHGNWILGAALLIALAVGGNTAWHKYRAREAAAASSAYAAYEQAAGAKDAAHARELAAALVAQHASSAYAALAELGQAKASVEAGDATAAKAQLHWVIDHASSPEFVAIARVRLAGVLLDEKAYDEGLAVLQPEAPAALAAAVSDRRGDLYLAQGKTADARRAYAKALEQASEQSPLRPLIQSKLDALPVAG